MAVLPAIAQSESKARLMAYLQLDVDNVDHQRVYTKMKARSRMQSTTSADLSQEEATTAARWMMFSQDILTHAARRSPSVQPPYSYHHVSEIAMKSETIRIYRDAAPETRLYYDLAHDRSGLMEENWLIRWMLWHVFRYRDGRNRMKRRRAWSDASTVQPSKQLDLELDDTGVDRTMKSVKECQSSSHLLSAHISVVLPAIWLSTAEPPSMRNGIPNDRRTELAPAQSAMRTGRSPKTARSLPYDPVRDAWNDGKGSWNR